MMKHVTFLQHLILIFCGVLLTSTVLAKGPPPETTHDGLVLKRDSKVAVVYVNPEADFSQYKKIQILDVYVAFKKHWQREHRVSKGDMNRIKRRAAELFRNVFVEVLEEGGYPVVYENGEDVLLVRPAIIDLDITAPDTMKAGRSRTYAANAGAATLYIELFDSNTSAILARAIDRKAGRSNYGSWRMTGTSVYNSAEARKILKNWATLLLGALESAQGKTN